MPALQGTPYIGGGLRRGNGRAPKRWLRLSGYRLKSGWI